MSVFNVYHDVSRETRFNFFLPIRHVIPVVFYISMGKPIGSQFGQKVGKIRTGKFRPEIAFTNQYHLPKNSREGPKLVENEFPLENSVRKNRTTFLGVQLLPEIFLLNDPKILVPFTFQLYFPETSELVSHRHFVSISRDIFVYDIFSDTLGYNLQSVSNRFSMRKAVIFRSPRNFWIDFVQQL